MKFKDEQYVIQRQSKKTGKYSFQVRIRTDNADVTKTFSEASYGNAREAYENAVKFKNKTLLEINERLYLKKTTITVKGCFDLFMKSTILSCSTRHKHKILFDKYFIHKDTPIQQLTRANIIEDLNAMVDIASDETITRVLSIWKKDIIETALNNEFTTRDLTLGLRAPKSHVYSVKKSTVTTRDDVLKVEDILWNSPTNSYNCKIVYYMLEVMYYTGMRPAEVQVLTRDDIHDTYISVTKELGSNKEDKNVVRRPKTQKSIRDIPIHANLKTLLDELEAFAKYDELFVDENGHYMNSTAIGSLITNRLKKSGIKFNMYMLRHNLATMLVTNGVDEKTIMEILGHTNYSMSLYYANSNDKLKENAIALMS